MTVASNLKLDVDVPQRTVLPWVETVMTMFGHMSESESKLFLTRTESNLEIVEKSDLVKASRFAVALAACKPVAPSLLWSRLELESGEKTDPDRNSQRCRVF